MKTHSTVGEYVNEALQRERRQAARGEINSALLEAVRNDDSQAMVETEWDDIKREGNRILARKKRE